ncbi:putative GTP-binding protein 6 [Ischnura elegans]|uniref:putative GTP-binding protein 6 n=1 Tax=Ischnura elegans TaxID=197161 RepID=UPI001ED8A603|nr:putative GTP-binding protein 6 [Ischnura elegans]
MLSMLGCRTCGKANDLFSRRVFKKYLSVVAQNMLPATYIKQKGINVQPITTTRLQRGETCCSIKTLSTSTKLFSSRKNESEDSTNEENVADFEGDQAFEYDAIAKRFFSVPGGGHRLIVIQPYVKWGQKKKNRTTPDLQLAEAVALVHSLQSWKVVYQLKVPLQTLDKKTLFGRGALESLLEKVRGIESATGIFISIDVLRGYQHRELEELFGLKLFDRYSIVMQIFRERAITKEAKLQVAMAEIPYLWSKMKLMHEGEASRQGYGGPGESYTEMRRRIFADREHKLKVSLEKLRSQRELLRTKRRKNEFPTVAVVGYTNAGKTSLIKALTGEEALQPKDILFATLDVTIHAGVLPSKMKVLYVDTVGFISDIPTNLIESFNATLEDALLADLVLHVCDMSHPDALAQSIEVTRTLQSLNISEKLKSNILVVGNKVDLVGTEDKLQVLGGNILPVSAVTEVGIDILKERIEESILNTTGRKKMVFKVPMGGTEASWLYKEATVTNVKACPENSQFLLMTVTITTSCLEKFKHRFI